MPEEAEMDRAGGYAGLPESQAPSRDLGSGLGLRVLTQSPVARV